MEFEDGFTLKDWKDVCRLDGTVLVEMATDRLRDMYMDTNKSLNMNIDFNAELEKIHKRLEDITSMERDDFFYSKHFYLMVQDLELSNLINHECWYMNAEDVDRNINTDKYIFEFQKHKDDEEFSNYKTVGEFVSDMIDFNHECCLDGVFDKIKLEFDVFYKKNNTKTYSKHLYKILNSKEGVKHDSKKSPKAIVSSFRCR